MVKRLAAETLQERKKKEQRVAFIIDAC